MMITLIPNLSIFGCVVKIQSDHYYIPKTIQSAISRCTNLYLIFLQEKFSGVDIRVTVKGGGHVAQVYAIRQAISKALIAFYQKCK